MEARVKEVHDRYDDYMDEIEEYFNFFEPYIEDENDPTFQLITDYSDYVTELHNMYEQDDYSDAEAEFYLNRIIEIEEELSELRRRVEREIELGRNSWAGFFN